MRRLLHPFIAIPLSLLIVLVGMAMLPGCQSYQLETADGTRLSVNRLMTDAEVGTLKAGRDENGEMFIELQGLQSETQQVAEAVARGITQGMR